MRKFAYNVSFTRTHARRHFLKEELPRIRFANPNLDIQVQQAKKTAEEQWRPEIELELGAFVYD